MKFYTLLITLFLLPGFSLAAQTYNEHDLSKLKAFLEQPSGAKRNIDLLWGSAPAQLLEDGSNWVSGLGGYVTWKNGRLDKIEAPDKNLSGKADFEGCATLELLYLKNNNFTAANMKGCTQLGRFYMCVNQLASINFDGCDNLRELSASSNSYTTLDLTNKAKLVQLYIPNNRLTSLNLKGCVALKELTFTKKGNIASLDLSDCVALTTLVCYGNNIKTLDLSKNPNLKTLTLTETDPTGTYTNPLTSLNISGCKQLESYDFIGTFPGLQTLNISNCGLSSIDLSKNTKLTGLEAGGQQLSVEKQTVDKGELKLDVLGINGIIVTPSDGGVFENGRITWTNLSPGEGKYTYDFTTELPAGVTGTPFGGTVSVPWYNEGSSVANMEVKNNPVVIYAANGMLYVRAETPQPVRVFNWMGQQVKQAASATEVSFYLPKGIYIVQSGNSVIQKIIVK